MKNQTVYLTDLLILRELFAPEEEFYLIDPAGRVIGEQERIPSPLQKVQEAEDRPSFVVDLRNDDFVLYSSSIGEERWLSFDFINNPDGTIRWFYPSAGMTAGHLSLYNAASVKARLYKTITRIAFRLGQAHRLASGTFRVQQKLFERVQMNCGIMIGEAASFFTGTRGATRKLVVEIHNEKETTGFIKIPLTPEANTLVENEYEMVNTLNQYDFTALSLPKASKRINGRTRLSNVKPAIVIPADRINAIHLSAMAELYSMSNDRKKISDTAAWESIKNNISFLGQETVFINNLSKEKTLDLVALLKELFNRVSDTELVPVSVSHGDFTPWNMYCDEQRLYVYDWEMARNGIPMMFDVFHFTYQSTILQQRRNYNAVKSTIHQWSQSALAEQMISKYGINLELHHRLYLLFTVSHYLRQYLGERELLMQSHWMVDAWTAAIRDCLSSIPNASKK